MFNLKNNRLLITAIVVLSFLVFLSLSPAIFKWVKGNASTAFLSLGSNDKIAISPDGKYVAYTITENSNETLIKLKQLAGDSEITLIKLDSKHSISGLKFYADSYTLYYTLTTNTGDGGEMYYIGANGIQATKVLKQADSEPSFSPDGNQFTYFLNHGDESQKGIRIASLDGTNDKLLIPLPHPENAVSDWSPDGKSLAYISKCPEGTCVSERMIENGSEKIISPSFQEIYSLQWLADKSGLIISGIERNSVTSQLYKITYPEGEVVSVTVGLDNYMNLKMTADSYLALAVKEKTQADLWVVSINNGNDSKQATNFGNLYRHVSWSKDGTILAVSNSNGIQQILSSDKNGNNFHEIIYGRWNTSPVSTPDGKFFVYLSKGGVWRSNINGENQKLISRTDINNHLLQNGMQLTPDSKWLVGNFNDKDGNAALRKINIETGEVISLSDKSLTIFSISPDGKQFAYMKTNEHTRNHLIVRPFESQQPTKEFDLPQALKIDFLRLRWTRDGYGVAYNFNENIWVQTLTETTPKQLTFFTSQTIYDFDFSPNGDVVVCSRGFTHNEVIQMRNLR